MLRLNAGTVDPGTKADAPTTRATIKKQTLGMAIKCRDLTSAVPKPDADAGQISSCENGRFRAVPADGRGADAGVQGCQGGQPRVRDQEGVHLPEGGEEVERVGEEGQRGKSHPLCIGRDRHPLPYFAPQLAKKHPVSDRKARHSLPYVMGRRCQSLPARAPLTRTSRKPCTPSLLCVSSS